MDFTVSNNQSRFKSLHAIALYIIHTAIGIRF